MVFIEIAGEMLMQNATKEMLRMHFMDKPRDKAVEAIFCRLSMTRDELKKVDHTGKMTWDLWLDREEKTSIKIVIHLDMIGEEYGEKK